MFFYYSDEATENDPDIQNVTPKFLYSLTLSTVLSFNFNSCLYNLPALLKTYENIIMCSLKSSRDILKT